MYPGMGTLGLNCGFDRFGSHAGTAFVFVLARSFLIPVPRTVIRILYTKIAF